MKKLLAVLALASVSLCGFAQEEAPAEKYSVATNSFGSNWFVQVGVDWNSWYSAEERGLDLSKSPLKKFRSNPGLSFAFGKWFTPSIGLRTKIQGFWGKTVDAASAEKDSDGKSNKYWVANEQVMFNLNNLFDGYKEERVWNLMAFVGAGIGRSMSHNNYAMNYSLGVNSSWKVAEKVSLFAELGLNSFDHNIDNCTGSVDQSWIRRCKNYYLEVGVTYHLGASKWKKAPDMDAVNTQHQAELDALNAALEDANAENERLRGILEKKQSGQNVQEDATPAGPSDSVEQ